MTRKEEVQDRLVKISEVWSLRPSVFKGHNDRAVFAHMFSYKLKNSNSRQYFSTVILLDGDGKVVDIFNNRRSVIQRKFQLKLNHKIADDAFNYIAAYDEEDQSDIYDDIYYLLRNR